MIRQVSVVVTALLLAGCSGSDSDPGSTSADTSPEVVEPAATRCAGTIGAEDVDGDLIVPPKKSCRLEGTAVFGRVTVSPGASLVAVDAGFGEGISAHYFDRVELLGGHAPDRPDDWYLSQEPSSKMVDFVFDGGRDVVVRDGYGNGNGQYYLLGNTGQVTIVGLSLDLGRIYCAGNTRPPKVRGISAESPGVLKGQCAGLKNFGVSDF
jgi:hypothetical protein